MNHLSSIFCFCSQQSFLSIFGNAWKTESCFSCWLWFYFRNALLLSEKCIGECSRKIAPCSSFFLPVLFLIYSIYLLSIYLLQWVLWVRILCKVLWETNKLALLALKEFVCLHSWDFAVRLVCSRLLLILKAFPYSTWEIFPTKLWGQSAQDVVLWRQLCSASSSKLVASLVRRGWRK